MYIFCGALVVMLAMLNLSILVFCLCLLLLVAFLVLLERKLLGLLQERKSPNVVGVFGLLQTVMDSIKLLLKKCYENYFSFYFFLLPVISMTLSFIHWFVIPAPYVMLGGEYTVLVSFVIMSLMVYVVLGCSYVSSSSYGVISGIRSVAQMVSYEVVFMFYILSFLFLLSVYSWKFIMNFNLVDSSFMKVFFIVIWLCLSIAELNRAPFDLVEGESELVSGYNVEYSGFSFTLLFLSEYMNIWFMGVLFCLIFVVDSFYFLPLVLSYSVAAVLIRGLLPRFKFVQLINLMWKVFLPSVFLFMFYYIVMSLV